MPDRRRQQGRVKLAGVMTADATIGDGAFARLVDRLLANRAAVGGTLIFGLVATVIVTNALFLQEAPHPDPLFATRSAPARATPSARPDPLASKIARLRGSEEVGSIPPASVPPVPQQRPDINALLSADTALVSGIQRRLAAARLYDGAIDGIYGARTRSAISDYQRSAGLPVTGSPSEALLARLEQDKAAAIQAMPPLPHPAPSATPPPTPVAGSDLVRDVQTALNTIGYGPVTIDGQLGGATTDAIRRFELDNGMAITGTVDERLIRRLVAIGAISAPR